ncbi:SIR2 family protein [Staphylococcus delphini]|nr:SIR2 family protein [Staphylococcus delphini]UXS29869.1 SIR2 family protein [Staphylococcus delphini]UXS37547.1 SIR2 family protein [Staphylococcus delphini]UXS45009.1 SIR2 family protein [Staphylococcus delphini]UXV45630.1 SIR2 family protein [Staphylococcus delphini]
MNLLKIHGSLTWERQNNNIIRKNKGEVNNPIMIFPSSNKYMQSYEKPYFDLFTKFQSLLRKSNTVLITSGFSFADNHISQMIIQAIKTNPSLILLVTDYIIEPEHPNENWEELLKLMNSDYNISFLQATMNGDLTQFFSRGENSD